MGFMRSPRPSHAPLTVPEVATLNNVIDTLGFKRAQTELQVGRHTLDRLCGSLPLHRGTLTRIRLALATVTFDVEQP